MYLTENVCATSTEIAELLGLKSTRAKEILSEMVSEGIIVAQGGNKNRSYKLKS
ncbi:MAG: winged helix-turn-helix domain-containing protein [Clostridia bacterium]|nr:winged helix-turn-helix domain-containing protein [Clostridia bacterium]